MTIRPVFFVLPLLLPSTSLQAQPPPNAEPINYRTEVLSYLRENLRDRTGVRDAGISRPFMRHMGVEYRYVTCVRFNARNGFGGYGGIKEYLAIYVNGRMSGFSRASANECETTRYEPFKELERL